MGKRFLKVYILCLLAVLFVVPRENMQAAVKKTDILTSWGRTSCMADLDGDGRKETLELKATMQDDYYMERAALYVDHRKVLALNDLAGDTSYISIDYLKMSDSKIFLRIVCSGDDNSISLDSFYKYDSKKKKLPKAGELMDIRGWCTETKVLKVSSTNIKVWYKRQFLETGSIQWISTYIVKNGKLKLKSNTAAAKSGYDADYSYNPDNYGKLFRKNKYKAIERFDLYSDTSLSKIAFTAEKKEILTLKKIKYIHNKFYVQFACGHEKGWIKIEEDPGKILFYGVNGRLAG